VTDAWHQFYEHWRDDSANSKFRTEFPYILEFGVGPKHHSHLRFHVDDTLGGRIVVTKAYDDMFHRLLLLRHRDAGSNIGAVLTGQPGIGVSL
jgi:hypothetical protein